MRKLVALAWTLVSGVAFAENKLPIIDMHLHSYAEQHFHPMKDPYGRASSKTVVEHFNETYQQMRKHNIVIGMLSTSKQSAKFWLEKDTEKRFLRGVEDYRAWTPKEFEEAVKAGQIKIFGEIGPYYEGKTLDDPAYAPYLKICEKYGIPLAVHTGGGAPRAAYTFAPKSRLKFGNPFLLEDALVKHPNLKVYLMHSGEVYYLEALRLMLSHPHVYSDLGVVLWVHDSPKYFGEEFLRLAKKFGLLDRVMFGSDQMRWPHAIEESINQLNSFNFLTKEEKRNIFYNNAARFLELDQSTIQSHHRKK